MAVKQTVAASEGHQVDSLLLTMQPAIFNMQQEGCTDGCWGSILLRLLHSGQATLQGRKMVLQWRLQC